MQRPCDRCRRPYAAERPSSRYCSDNCRQGAARARRAGVPIALATVSDIEPSSSDGPLTAATLAQLTDAERVESPMGQAALAISRRIDAGHENGSAVAALVRELRSTLAAALEGGVRQMNALDEIAERRKAKAAGA